MANIGIKDYGRYLRYSVDGAGEVIINVCPQFANTHVNIPLYKSSDTPFQLSLMFNYSDKNNNGLFGKGIFLNYRKKLLKPEGGKHKILNPDGSVEEYISGQINHESKATLTYTSQEERCKLEYINGVLCQFDYSTYYDSELPKKMIYPNGTWIEVNDDLKQGFMYSNNQQVNAIYYDGLSFIRIKTLEIIEYTGKNYKIEFEFNENEYLKGLKIINEKNEIIQSSKYLFSKNQIMVEDTISGYRVTTILDDYGKVISVYDGYGDAFVQKINTGIAYRSTGFYSKVDIVDLYNIPRYIFFDKKGMPMYEIDNELGTVNYTYNKYNMLISKTDYYYNEFYKSQELGNKVLFSMDGELIDKNLQEITEFSFSNISLYKVDTAPFNDMFQGGATRVSVKNALQALKMKYSITGKKDDQISFMMWAKQESPIGLPVDEYGYETDEPDYRRLKCKLILRKNGSDVSTKEIYFDSEYDPCDVRDLPWQHRILEIKSTGDFDEVLIEILLNTRNYYYDIKYALAGLQLYYKPIQMVRQYNEMQQLISSSFGNNETIYKYGNNGMLTESIGTDTGYYNAIYDNKNRLLSRETADNVVTTYEYNQEYGDKVTQIKIENENELIVTNSQYDYSHSNLIIENHIDDAGNITKIEKMKSSQAIKQIIDPRNTLYQYSYNDKDELNFYIADFKEIEYINSNDYKTQKIKLPNSQSYIYQYDKYQRLESVGIEGLGDIATYKYKDEISHSEKQIKSNKIDYIQHGQNGDKFIFSYVPSKDVIQEISLLSKGSTVPNIITKYGYDSLGRLESVYDTRTYIQTSYEYNDDGQIIRQHDYLGNESRYEYNNLGEILRKKTESGSKQIIQTFDNLSNANGVNRLAFMKLFKNHVNEQDMIYSCFFNESVIKDGINKITSNLTANYLKHGYKEEVASVYAIQENNVSMLKENELNFIRFNDVTSTLSYNIETMSKRVNDFISSNASVAFWFKPNTSMSGKWLIRVGGEQGCSTRMDILVESQSSVSCRFKGTNGEIQKLSITNNIKLHEWNFIGFSWEEREELGPAFPKTIELTINLNETTSAKSIVKNLFSDGYSNYNEYTSTQVHIGGNGSTAFNGDITALMITNRFKLGNYEMKVLKQKTKHYLFNKSRTDVNDKKYKASGTNLFHEQEKLFQNRRIDIIPLNNTLTSINNKKPIKYTGKKMYSYDQDQTFIYDKILKRYVYDTLDQQLIYNFSLSDVGMIGLKLRLKGDNKGKYLFESRDLYDRTLSLFLDNNNQLIIKLNSSEYLTNIYIKDNDYHTIGLNWRYNESNDPENGNSYDFILRLDSNTTNSKKCEKNIKVSFRYLNMKTAIAGTLDHDKDNIDANIDSIFYDSRYLSDTIYNEVITGLDTFTKSREYDTFDLLRKEYVTCNQGVVLDKSFEYKKIGTIDGKTKISTLIDSENIKIKNKTISRKYEYDGSRNVTQITEGGTTKARYNYSNLNRLSSELINFSGGKLVGEYRYDVNGNILYVLITNKDVYQLYEFLYHDPLIKDRLTAIKYNNGNEKKITYQDAYLGNPSQYGTKENGITYSWEGKRLVELVEKEDNTTKLETKYLYNDQGLRIKRITKKTNIEEVSSYYYEGTNLISETKEVSDKINHTQQYFIKQFLYDEMGSLYGMKYQGEIYYYVRDIFGNILELIDKNGKSVVEYVHDAYGNIISILGDLKDTIGKENPFLYKGYYYDFDSNMYYCHTRYYVPEWRRWLNADNVSYLDSNSINGLNLYAYCGNNPIMYYDPDGHLAILISIGIGILVGIVSEGISDLLDDGKINGGLKNYLVAGAVGGLSGLFAGLNLNLVGTMLTSGLLEVGGKVALGEVSSFEQGVGVFIKGAVVGGLTYGLTKTITKGFAANKYNNIRGLSSKNIVVNKQLGKMGYTLKIGKNSMDDFIKVFLEKDSFKLLDHGISSAFDLIFNIVG